MPEIIKTDVANFRELVQSLTGQYATREADRQANGSVSINNGTNRKKVVEKQREIIPRCLEIRGHHQRL